MNQYKVYFEIYGKKLKTIVQARNETEARDKVKAKLNILKVEKVEDDTVDHFKSIFGF